MVINIAGQKIVLCKKIYANKFEYISLLIGLKKNVNVLHVNNFFPPLNNVYLSHVTCK